MIYKDFGRTGEKISALGFGCMRLPEYEKDGKWFVDQEKTTQMLLRAYELGVNYFDSAYYYCHENSEIAVGKALKSVRDKVLISTKCPMYDDIKAPGDYRRMLEKSLKKLDSDYIDFYHFWSINKKVFDEKIMGMNIIEEALKAKEEGLIRHISFSFHDNPEYIKHIIDTAGVMETMLVQYNLLDRSHEEMIDYAASKGLGVVAMGPVGGGRLAMPTDLNKKLTGSDSVATYELALKFVMGNKNISCALSGMQNIDMVEKNAKLASDVTLSEKEWEDLRTAVDKLVKFSELYCTGCGYCQPCPKEINIPYLFNIYTHHNVYGLSEHAKLTYDQHVDNKGKTSKDCVECGICEKKCPQKLAIRDKLKMVDKVMQEIKINK